MTTPTNDAQVTPDAALTTCMGDLDAVFAASAGIINRRQANPQPGDDAELARLRRLHQALRRRLNGFPETPRVPARTPAPPPPEGFSEGMEWATGDWEESPPTPPAGFTWRTSFEDDAQIRVCTLIPVEVVPPEILAEDQRILAAWDAQQIARTVLHSSS